MEIYVSVDIEADGPIPGVYSMLSLGAVAVDRSGVAHGEFSVNLREAEGAISDPDTMAWWAKHQDAWKATRIDRKEPLEAMETFVRWCEALPGKPVFVGYPAGYDFLFVYWYLIRYVGFSPFSFSALDLKTMAMVLNATDYRDSNKRSWPKKWFDSNQAHNHVAVDDARGQAYSLVQMFKEAYGDND